MTAERDRPPARWLALVRALLPAARRDEVEGDLMEGWQARADLSRVQRAWAFWRDAVSVAVPRRRPHHATHQGRSRFGAFAASFVHDIGAAGRLLVRRPAFSVLTIATLAIGMASATAVFAITDRVLFQPLPFPEPERLVALSGVNGQEIQEGRLKRYANLRELWSLGAYYTGSMNVGATEGPGRARVASVSPDFFAVFGVHPTAGRVLTPDDDPENALAVVAFDAWHRLYGGRASLIGQNIRLNSRSYLVLGVMPRGFRFPDATDIWISGMADAQASGSSRIQPSPKVVARLAPGRTPAEAAAAFTRADVGRYTRPQPPATAVPLQEQLTIYSRPALLMMAAVVALLLTATGASAAGLFLSQLRARERELIVRSALGAGRWRLIRQLVAECLLLTAGAAGVGLILAAGSLEVIASGLEAVPGVAAADADLSRVDGRFMAVGAAICTVAGLLFGVVPALTASRPHAARILRVGPGGSSRAGMFGNGLVVAQMAVALVLLTVTGAALTRFVRLVNVDLGFSNTRALTFDVTLPKERYSGRAGAVEFFARFHERLQTVPGVAHVGATNVGPRWTGTPVVGIRVRLADSDVNANQAPTPPQLAATPDYFAAMGIRLITGRTFTMEDSWPGAAPVVIVSESVATSLGVTAVAAVGRRVQLESDRNMADVIGVVRDVRLGSVSGFRFGQLYEPLSERRGWFDGRLSLAIDSTGDTVHLMEAARAVLADIDSDLTLYNVVQVQDLRAVYLPTERMTLAATGVFSTIALALCAVGLYGVLSQSVAQRTREVGIRIALGADLTRVRRSVVATGFRFAVSGGIIGSAGAYLGFKAGAAVLPRLDAPSFAMMACNSLVLLAVAAVAAWVPARRAAAVDPIQALRVE